MTKRCKLGESDKRIAARKDWANRNRKIRTRAIDHVSTPIGSLPPPPPPGSDDAVRCMDHWMDAYNDAKALEDTLKTLAAVKAQYTKVAALPPSAARDSLLKDIAKLIAELEQKARMLKVAVQMQTAAYLDCIQGMPA